jgi:hypothetical protein
MQELTERHETHDLVANINVKWLKGQGNAIRMEQTEMYLLWD